MSRFRRPVAGAVGGVVTGTIGKNMRNGRSKGKASGAKKRNGKNENMKNGIRGRNGNPKAAIRNGIDSNFKNLKPLNTISILKKRIGTLSMKSSMSFRNPMAFSLARMSLSNAMSATLVNKVSSFFWGTG